MLRVPAAYTLLRAHVSYKIITIKASPQYEWQGSKTYLPKVLYHGILLVVPAVVGVLHPIIDVNLGNTTDEQLQLPLVKHIDKICRYELVEALDKGVELLLYTLLNTPFRHKPAKYVSIGSQNKAGQDGNILDVFLLVVVINWDVSSSRLQVNSLLLTKDFVFNGKVLENDIVNVVLEHP